MSVILSDWGCEARATCGYATGDNSVCTSVMKTYLLTFVCRWKFQANHAGDCWMFDWLDNVSGGSFDLLRTDESQTSIVDRRFIPVLLHMLVKFETVALIFLSCLK